MRRVPVLSIARAAMLCVAGLSTALAQDALIEAVKTKSRGAALAALEKGADVRAREVDGTTALHYAIYNGDADLVQRLIRAGANVSAKNEFGATPLSVAAVTADPAIIEHLLK